MDTISITKTIADIIILFIAPTFSPPENPSCLS
jgi:hypothetical protein